jgi:hypothetical protein
MVVVRPLRWSLVLAAFLTVHGDSLSVPAPVEVVTPAPPGSGSPQMTTTNDGRAVLSWLEPAGPGRHRFRYSIRTGSDWSTPVTISEEERVFANWADVPTVAIMPDNTWVANWLSSTGRGSYDINVSFSKDGGRTWSVPTIPHRDGTKTEHGFVSFAPWPGGGVGMIWLDGRDYARFAGAEHHGLEMMKAQMSLRAMVFKDGRPGAEAVVDSRVCDCCPTALTATAKGVVAAYRDRSAAEIRDIYVARYENGRWLRGRAVHNDDWKIPACPVNGPALASRGDRVAIAWFTAAGDVGRVYAAVSEDAGTSFGTPQRIDDGRPEGRVGVVMLADGSAVVQWIERLEEGGAEVRVRRLTATQETGPARRVATITSDRASGYPRIVAAGRELVFAWTDKQVKTAVAPLP